MTTKQKPDLTLLSGDKAQSVDYVIKLFERLLGRPCTAQEIADAKAWKPKESQPPNDTDLPHC
jgi:hypothetical protein